MPRIQCNTSARANMNIELNFSALVSTITAWPLQEACHGISGLSRDMNISIIGNKENVTFDIVYGDIQNENVIALRIVFMEEVSILSDVEGWSTKISPSSIQFEHFSITI